MEENQSTIDEYSEAANIIRLFLELGPIAKSMVVGGLNEIRGENILEGGGERESKGPSTKGGKRGKDTPFEFETNFNNSGSYTLGNNNKKASRTTSGGTSTITSKTLFKGSGKYTFEINLNCMHPGSYCFGVVSNTFSEWTNYACNSQQGRALCGDGYMGSSDGSRDSSFHYNGNSNLVFILDLDSKQITLHSKGNDSITYNTSISSLSTENGVRLAASMGSSGEFVEVVNVKYSK
eukprot:TRINITY_DN639_c0_g1_i1.p1 TRINITY_DN639_c0_g1~~TRINITY_DN639_c0_g1_i1.p1  ORF type:complete len:236 (-),score=74.30 TRINITY_DN639_c0_g1_i1:73-780(-)